jgi:hypothetical protein
METDEYYTTALLRFRTTNVETAEPAGTGGRSMSSSCSTDFIPEKIRRIFEEADTDKWVIVYYITKHSEIICRVAFFFEGRDKVYEEECESSIDGSLARVVIVYRAKVAHYEVNDSAPRHDLVKGERFKMTIQGEIIP